MIKKFFLAAFVLGLIFVRTEKSFAYDAKTTHAALTSEIVDFVNGPGGTGITAEEKGWLVQGTIEEDTPPRWVNHFYDPVHGISWNGDNVGYIPPSLVNEIFDIGVSPVGHVTALDWVNDQSVQQQYGLYGGDQTWKRALKYYADGDKQHAYIALGHALHLIEDMSVPDHTRNDPHAHELAWATGDYGSPYEVYLTKWTQDTIKQLHLAETLRAEGAVPPNKSSIEDYITALATYSNNYFFSKDTINNSAYDLPKIVRTDENFGYGIDEKGNEFPIAKAKLGSDQDGNPTTSYIIDISSKKILDAYFDRLSRQAILYGAGVISLFNSEAPKAAADAAIAKEYPQHLVMLDPKVMQWLNFPQVSLFGTGVKAYNAALSFLGQVKATMSGALASAGNLFSNLFVIADAPPPAQISAGNLGGQAAPTPPPAVLNPAPPVPAAPPAPQTPPPAPQPLPPPPAGESPKGIVLALATTDEGNSGVAGNPPAGGSPAAADPPQTSGSGNSPIPQGGVSITENLPPTPPAPPPPPAPPAPPPPLFSQPTAEIFSHGSHWGDNWYNLGSGYSGTLHSLELRGHREGIEPFASRAWLKEFKDADYQILTRTITLSDDIPFDDATTTVKFDNLSIDLKPFYYYRLETKDDMQNRSVILLGTDTSTPAILLGNGPEAAVGAGTAMWDEFIAGRSEFHYPFTPYLLGIGDAGDAHAAPRPIAPPANLTLAFDNLALNLNLSWSASADPEWPDNHIHYEINYATATAPGVPDVSALNPADWQSTRGAGTNLSASIHVAAHNNYLVAVRALDNYGDVSSPATQNWSFPAGFVPYVLSDPSDFFSQSFSNQSAGALQSIEVFTAEFSTNVSNSSAITCAMSLYDEDAGASLGNSDNSYAGYGCAGNLTFTFAGAPVLAAGHHYRWYFGLTTNRYSNAGVRVYGVATDTAGGNLRGNPDTPPNFVPANARFILHGDAGVLFQN